MGVIVPLSGWIYEPRLAGVCPLDGRVTRYKLVTKCFLLLEVFDSKGQFGNRVNHIVIFLPDENTTNAVPGIELYPVG